jgi:TonB family protein
MALVLPSAVRAGGTQTRPDDPLPSPVFSVGEHSAITPTPLHIVPAEYSDDARKAKYQGFCLVRLIVDEHGMPRDAHVIRPLGMGLDQNAVAAVKQYRFKPGIYNGKPVAVRLSVVVNFNTPQ